jgi:CHAD domain-containing protein
LGLEPLAVDPARPIAAEVKRLAIALCDDALRQLETAAHGDREEAVHEARKRFKELRALLRLLECSRIRRRARAARRTIRDAGLSLSGARDADVLAETFEKLCERYGAEMDGSRDLRALMLARASAEPLETADAVRLAGRVRNDIALWPIDAGPDEIRRAFGRGYRTAREAMTAALRSRNTADFHEWRKRAKDHWYHTRMLERVLTPIAYREPPLHRLSRILGDHHDLVLATEAAAAHGSVEVAAVVNLAGFARERMRELEREAAVAGMETLGRPSRSFRRDIAAMEMATVVEGVPSVP